MSSLVACQPIKNSDEDRIPELAGAWQLLSIEKKDSASSVWKPSEWMKDGSGVLFYDQHENMSVHFLPKDYSGQDSARPYWYLATYKINADSGFVEHKRYLHSIPEENYKTVRRRYHIIQDTLILSASEYNFRLKWLKKGN